MLAPANLPARQRLMLAITLVVAFIVLFALAEAAVRLRHSLKYGWTWGVQEIFFVDRVTGLRLPVANGEFGPIRINSAHFRSPEIPMRKPERGLRIAFLGGSTTFCAEVSSNEATWPHLVWQGLQEHWPDAHIDYLNAGVSGYTLRSMKERLERQVRDHAPDVIVLYEATNDLASNSRKQAEERGAYLGGVADDQMSWPSQYSLLVFLVEKNLKLLSRHNDEENKITLDEDRLNARFHADLSALVASARAVAPVVALATFSPRLRDGQSAAELKEAAVSAVFYMPYLTPASLLRHYRGYNEVIRKVAAEHQVLLVGNEESIPADTRHYADSVHFTDDGARAMAKRVVDQLLAAPEMAQLVEARTKKMAMSGR